MKLKRREFLKTAVSAVAGAGFYLTTRGLFPQESVPDVASVRGADYERSVTSAIDLVGGIRRYVSPGDVVVVKPNIAWNSPPELKANTDPVIVRTVVHLCFQALASKVYVFDRTCSNPKLSYRTSGIAAAAESAGAKVLFVDDVSKKLYPGIKIKGASFLNETTVNRYVLESDVFINLPVAKHHSSAGLTIGMKNLMGITGDNRSKWHWQLHDAIADINRGVKSNLIVVDATNLMVRNGPTGGSKDYLQRNDTVIASSNVVSADAETALLFGRTPESIEYIRIADRYGIGRMNGYSRKLVEL